MSRGGIDHFGIGLRGVTYEADAALKEIVVAAGGPHTATGRAAAEGKAVTRVSGTYKAGFGDAGDPVLGIVDVYDADGMMTVSVEGFATVPGVSGSLPNVNDVLVVNGSGAVMASAGAIGMARADAVLSDAADGTGPVMVYIG